MKKLKILIIDTNPIINIGFKSIFKNSVIFEVVAFTYKKNEINEIINQQEINLVISEINFKDGNVKDVLKFQNNLNKEFANKQKSPLTEEDFKTFEAVDFFPIDTNYRVVAKLKFFKDSKTFKMKTTTDRLPEYKIYASATFEINGKEYMLHIYQNQKIRLIP